MGRLKKKTKARIASLKRGGASTATIADTLASEGEKVKPATIEKIGAAASVASSAPATPPPPDPALVSTTRPTPEQVAASAARLAAPPVASGPSPSGAPLAPAAPEPEPTLTDKELVGLADMGARFAEEICLGVAGVPYVVDGETDYDPAKPAEISGLSEGERGLIKVFAPRINRAINRLMNDEGDAEKPLETLALLAVVLIGPRVMRAIRYRTKLAIHRASLRAANKAQGASK